MPVTSRSELKNKFQRGLIPSQQDFENLIESVINPSDDNLKKSPNTPLQIGNSNTADNLQKMIEFFRGAVSGNGVWSVGLSAAANKPGLAVMQGAANRLFIQEGTGNVGIFNDSPSAPLSFAQTLGPKIALFPDAPEYPTSFYGFEIQGGELRIRTTEVASDVVFGFQGRSGGLTETMRVKGNGNVGIGRSDPRFPFHVFKNITDWLARFENASPGGSSVYLAHNGHGAYIDAGTGASAGTYALNVNKSNSPFLYVRGDGNVGIGTSTPEAKFVIDNGTVGYGFGKAPYYLHPFSSNSLIELAKIRPSPQTGSIYVSEFNHDVYMNTLLLRTSDFTELFESEGAKTIPIGTAVLLTKEGLIRPVEKSEIPIGVISVAPAIICNNATEWPAKYLKNEFGQNLTEEVEEDITTPDGKTERAKVQKPILNPDYDPNREYIPRDQRPEWHPVGLLDQLHLRKGQPVAPSWVKIKDVSENVELWLVK